MEPSTAKPCLKIVGLHVEGFRALRRVDWPADGTGWNGTVPDMVVVGGVNGSGKTTLLELIAAATSALSGADFVPPGTYVDIQLSTHDTGETVFRVVAGDTAFINEHRTEDSVFQRRVDGGYTRGSEGKTFETTRQLLLNRGAYLASDFPSIVYLPSERRFKTPQEGYKAAGKLNDPRDFFYRFTPADSWQGSLEAVLYSARWEDLNAKEEGHPERATHFESYTKAFQAFFGDTKQLVWEGGELFVKVADTGALHPLMELSSGEKQALILAAELYRRWRPGSLILIDEPELHFHSSWQTALYSMLERWQKERGGQVIIATQSTHLFRIATPGTTVLLGGPLS